MQGTAEKFITEQGKMLLTLSGRIDVEQPAIDDWAKFNYDNMQ